MATFAAPASAAREPGRASIAEVTVLTKSSGPLTKRIFLDPSGRVVSDGSACVMWEGHAARAVLAGPEQLAALIGGMPAGCALALGRLRADLPGRVSFVTERRLRDRGANAPAGVVARTREFIDYAAGEAAYALLDFDRKGMPEQAAEALAAGGGFWPTLLQAAPGLAEAARVRRASTSSGLINTLTGEPLGGGGGEHVYVLVVDGTDVDRFLGDLHDRCWLRGLGWYVIGAVGQLLERSVVDRAVVGPERLVFEGAPVLTPPLAQDRSAREPEWHLGVAVDTRAACPPLTPVERARVEEAKRVARALLMPEAARVRIQADEELARRLQARHGVPRATALRMAEARHRGVLLPFAALEFDDPAVGTATVADVLREPESFVGETLADPLEGVQYGRCKAKVMRRPADGSLWIHSFAHGRTVYELRHDAASAEAALRAVPAAAVIDELERCVLMSELEPDEFERVCDAACSLSGAKRRAVKDRMKEAQSRRRALEAAMAIESVQRRTAAAHPGVRRTRLRAPSPDDERTPVLEALDEVLGAVGGQEPPMRNADGLVVEIRARRPWGLHELTEASADAEEAPEDRLPAPEEPLITALDPVHLGLLIEAHIEHYRETKQAERTVALPDPFVGAYLRWSASQLPVVRAVVTAPLVTRRGALLAGVGLDRRLEIVFRIGPGLLALVPPDPRAITDADVAEAMRFLVDEWLCDVATGFAGRVVLLAYAMTLIERVLLPERPAWFVTAGQRGAGKTIVLAMLAVAVLGRRPAAAAWSPSPEERRKALLAYLGQGVATLIWDNVERGAAISCPHIERALTTIEYTDRILGVTRSVTVPSTTVMAVTGNNVAPKGDLASRSLVCRLEVERPDPENREFRHPDPVAWTLDNRGRILMALYTLLRWNPRLRVPPAAREPAKTRFKTLWELIGAPLEAASELAVAAQTAAAEHGRKLFNCSPESIDFDALFAAGEANEEETSGMRELVRLLRREFGEHLFTAAEVAALLHAPSGDLPFADRSPEAERQAALERAQTARGALEDATGKKLPSALTPHVVGKRLQTLIGRPVGLGAGEVAAVVKARTDHEANAYRVRLTRKGVL